jgi:hypothetical protein
MELQSALQHINEVPDTVVNHGLGAHLDLDAVQTGRRFAGGDLRVVERDLADGGVALARADIPRNVLHDPAGGGIGRSRGAEREGPPVGPNFEESTQVRRPEEPPNAFADRPGGSLRGLDVAFERLGDLAPPPEILLDDGEGLHRRLGALAVPADAQSVARTVEAPVLSVVVGVRQLFRRSGDDVQAGGGRMIL